MFDSLRERRRKDRVLRLARQTLLTHADEAEILAAAARILDKHKARASVSSTYSTKPMMAEAKV